MTELATAAETADSLEQISNDGIFAYQQSLQDGAPVAARQAYADSTAAVHEMTALGAAVGPQAAKLRAEAADLARQFGTTSENAKLKASAADALVADAQAKIGALSERSHALASVTEAALKASLVPALPADSGSRAMARAEIDKATQGLKGAPAVAALRHLVTAEDSNLTAEVLSPYVERIIGDPEHVQMHRNLAVATLLGHPNNARRAAQMAGLGRARGSIDAGRTAAQLRLGGK